MYSYTKKVEYKKYLTISEEYGASVLWEMDVEDEEKEEKPTEKNSYKKEYSKKKRTELKKEEEKNTECTFSKKDMDSLILEKNTIIKIRKEPISYKQQMAEKTELAFVNKPFIKPVFVNKKYTDEGAAF